VIGKSISHFTIVDRLGAGGMGEVWRATDSRLGREVALKILPPAFAQDAERMARFQREAQVLASLNHPNIGAIYGIEETPDSRVLVLELVEGDTLAERLRSGRLPVRDALSIAAQIAEAVEDAHERGIVHRDLKPANVKVTPDEGRVKVLDFGLAKAIEGSAARDPSCSDSLSPTISPVITGAMTGANVILGTAAYMSPEQARGQPVDKRADIWAFGVILFEMLTGRSLFHGETVSDTLASVLKTDPTWDALPDDTPLRIRRLLRRCLERSPKDRLRDIGDARLAIREVLSGKVEAAEPGRTDVPPSAASRRRWLLPAVAVISAAIAAALLWMLRPGPPEPPLRKFAIPFETMSRVTDLALSPDESAIAGVLNGRLWVRDFVTMEDRRFPGSEEVYTPFWSPDGEWIAYGTRNALWKVRRTGGEPLMIAALADEQEFTTVAGGAWGEDGRIVFASGNGGLWRIAAQGGDPALFVSLGEGEQDYHCAVALPEGNGWAFLVHREDGFDTIGTFSAGGERGVVLRLEGQNLFNLTWSSSGHLLFRRSGNAAGVWALPFDAETLEATGDPFLAAPGGSTPAGGRGGTLAYMRGGPSRETLLALLDRSGEVRETTGDPALYLHFPTLSPDGRWIVCGLREGETRNLWLVDVARGTRRRFSSRPDRQDWGTWDADGRELWYYATTDGFRGTILVRPATGAGEPREITRGILPEPSPDDRWLLFTRAKEDEPDLDLWILALDEEGAEPVPLLATDSSELRPVPSPTDPLVAYVSDVSGREEIYLATYPEIEWTRLVSKGGGWWPVWRADGRELFYAVGDSILAVDVEAADGDVRLGKPRLLFRRPRYEPTSSSFPDAFDVTANGETIVTHVLDEAAAPEPPTLVIVQNWFSEFE
jgi:serine/threonine protein kinase/Tol biopolymer transport system component